MKELMDKLSYIFWLVGSYVCVGGCLYLISFLALFITKAIDFTSNWEFIWWLITTPWAFVIATAIFWLVLIVIAAVKYDKEGKAKK